MARRYATAIIAVVLSSSVITPGFSIPPKVELIHKGCFHGNEVSDSSAGEWLALCRRGDGFEVERCRVQVKRCHDFLDEKGDTTGRSVVIDGAESPIFLVRGFERRGSPRVATSWSFKERETYPRYLAPGEELKMALDGVSYRLVASGSYDPSRPKSDPLVLKYRLELQGKNGTSQALPVPARFILDGCPTLLWAGDLDGDRKLDLYMDTTNHYNVRNFVLFLSSRARAGHLVELVAERRYVGC